ncbi:MAG: hypothetical protein NVSMB27_03560 [Ktedonobacteraceae bacterium]
MEARTQTPTLKESTIVERVARIVSSVRGAKADYTRLAAELEPAIPFDVFGVVLLRHDRQAVRVTVCQREGNTWTAQYHQHPLEGSKLEQVLYSPVTLVENYPAGLDGLPATSGDALSGCQMHILLRATLIAPLIVGERVLGTLELGSSILNAYADENLQRLIGAVVRVLAAAIESAQVGGSAEIQDRQRQALKDVSSALTSKMDLSSILNQIVVGIAGALNVASAIVTFDQREGKLHLEAQSGLDPKILSDLVARKGATSEKAIIGFTLHRRQPSVSNDIDTDDRFPLSRIFSTELGIRSLFSYPLVTDTTVYGALLLFSPEPGGFTPLKADILSLFASQATIAIHNGMLIESAHQRSRFQQAIEQLEWAYQQNGDEQEMLAQVRRETERSFGVGFTSLLHFISEHLLTRSERSLHDILHPTNQATSPIHPIVHSNSEHLRSPWGEFPLSPASTSSQPQGIELLTQTAEAALARVQVLSELGRLFIQQTAGHRKDAWFVVDLNGYCIYMNPAAQVFSGMRIDTPIKSTLEDVFAELLPRIRNVDQVRAYLHEFSQVTQDLRCVLAMEPIDTVGAQFIAPFDVESLLAGKFLSRTSLHEDTSSTDYHYQLSRHPLENQQGLQIANVLQVHDVTEQVRDEKNKSALLSSVSHELRTPLTAIKAAVSGLLQVGVTWDEATQREILQEIDTETDHLAVLVNALVEMSRIEMGALELEKEWCDIIEVVHGALIRLERVLAGRAVRTSFQPNLPLIYADHLQLERVFYNLVENTLRHTSDSTEILLSLDIIEDVGTSLVGVLGMGDQTASAHLTAAKPGTQPAPIHHLRVRVIDLNCVVPISERQRMFKTVQGINGRRSGLDLAICRGIIEAHQGHIRVEAVPGEDNGSCFVFTLPVHAHVGARFITPQGLGIAPNTTEEQL